MKQTIPQTLLQTKTLKNQSESEKCNLNIYKQRLEDIVGVRGHESLSLASGGKGGVSV